MVSDSETVYSKACNDRTVLVTVGVTSPERARLLLSVVIEF